MDYDHFAIYGFKVQYPADWIVELNPKSQKKRGDVVFHFFPKKEKIFVTWTMLEEVKKKYASLDEQVDKVIERTKKGRGVKTVEVVERKELEMNGHNAIFTHLRAKVIQPSGFLKVGEILQEARSFHLYCEQTSRYFIAYGLSSSSDASMDYADAFEHILESFRCHTEET